MSNELERSPTQGVAALHASLVLGSQYRKSFVGIPARYHRMEVLAFRYLPFLGTPSWVLISGTPTCNSL